MTEHEVYLGLGSNQGNRAANLRAAIGRLAEAAGTVVDASAFYQTRPVGPPGQCPYLNAAVKLRSTLEPATLASLIDRIEHSLGRVRTERWGPRTIDIDVLLWNEQWVDLPQLTVPHPWLPVRRFVLEPLAEIAPLQKHPCGWSIAEQRARIRRRPIYIALTGPLGVGKTTAAERFAAAVGALFVREQFDEAELARVYRGDQAAARRVQNWFAESRRQLLDRARLAAADTAVIVSDFWFGQSYPYALAELAPEEAASHRRRLESLWPEVYEPTVVVLLDAPPEELARRVRRRGRAAEATVTTEFLSRLRACFFDTLRTPPAPPSITLPATDVDSLQRHLLYLLESMM